MRIQFLGAAREVTGSKHLITVNNKRILLDCGMFQGRRAEADQKNRNLPFDAKTIDAVILSHAHIDHSGLIPYLVKQGFEGPIYTTAATRDLCGYMLADSAFIQEREFEYMNKKKKKCCPPLYTTEDATNAMKQFVGMPYEKAFTVTDGVIASFYDAGHILGSAITHFIIHDTEKNDKEKNHGNIDTDTDTDTGTDTGEHITLAYTGDLGRKNLPLLRDPQPTPPAHYFITEATYGNRLHAAFTDMKTQLAEMINKTAARGGKIIIPAFALERTQEIVYLLNILTRENAIPEIPIFADSPLSGNLTEVFINHPECMDKDTYKEFLEHRENPFGFGKLKYVFDVEESKKLNELKTPAIIISASGMCEFGRVLHHLKNNIENPHTTILIVGYQAANTLGRKLRDGAKSVNIFGDPYKVNAEVVTMDGFSAHADRSDLLDYIHRIQDLKKIFLVHAEEGQGVTFCDILTQNGYKDVVVPHPGEEFEIG